MFERVVLLNFSKNITLFLSVKMGEWNLKVLFFNY